MSIFGSDIGPPLFFLLIGCVTNLGVCTFENSLSKFVMFPKKLFMVSALSDAIYPLKLYPSVS